MEKKLYRKSSDKMLCGVCAGLADYFSLDVSLVRLGWVVLCCFGGAGIVAYIVSAIIIPEQPVFPDQNNGQ